MGTQFELHPFFKFLILLLLLQRIVGEVRYGGYVGMSEQIEFNDDCGRSVLLYHQLLLALYLAYLISELERL